MRSMELHTQVQFEMFSMEENLNQNCTVEVYSDRILQGVYSQE
jgi:hypothetical protein